MDLSHFHAGSANDDKYPELWEKQAGMFIDQLINITPIDPKIVDISVFPADEDAERLSRLFHQYGSDKSSHHMYHLMYAHLLKPVQNSDGPYRILEIGIGTNNPNLVSTMGAHGSPGASLRAFRDCHPNAQILGADIDTACLFEEERIKTCYTDQLSLATLESTLGCGFYNMIIDDGLHAVGANLNVILFGLRHLLPGGVLVVEDIDYNRMPLWRPIDAILRHKYETFFVRDISSMVYVIKNNL